MNDSKLYTTDEAAAYLGVSPSWLKQTRSVCYSGEPGPAWIKAGERRVRYDGRDLLRWVSMHRVDPQEVAAVV